ncbi:MAG: M12 family metallo-peptidase [Steroidobacteraceae bacterium]|nr:M12 family metallo-peptidase [Steroidobacteraceae bacterium]
MSSRHQIRHAIASVLFTACVVAWAPDASAAGNAPEHALKASVRIGDSELPAIAKRGTGVSGEFNPSALGAPEVALVLADGRVIMAKRQRVDEDKARGRKSWVGAFADQPGSIAVMTTHKGVTTGFVTYGAETWELMPGKGGRHMLYRVDDSKLPTIEPEVVFEATANDVIGASDYGTGVTADATGGYVHDLLVVYTAAARAAYGQTTLESMIQNAVVAANQAYLNSKINITLNLVGLQEIAYTETGDMQTSLNDLRGTTDGKIDSVHDLRNQVAADIVSLVSQDSSSCGIGGVLTTLSTSSASNAFNVVKPSCLSQHTLAHEVGHNQGNKHDRESSTGAGAYPYSYGFRRCVSDGTGFRTVMSYSCSGASRVAWFSNPDAYYNGYSTGIAYETDPTNSADNARSMTNTAAIVASFRSSNSITPVSSAPAAPSSLTATATSSSGVSLKWVDNSGNESGFKVEQSSNGVDYTEIATLGEGTVAFSNSGLSALTTYYYRVRAYNSEGNSGYSNAGSARTPDVPPVEPASVAAANNGDGSAAVSWVDASSNETAFEVTREKWDTKFSRWSSATMVGTTPSGIVSLVDMAGAGTYRYSVRAVNSGGASKYVGPAQTTVSGGTTTTSKGKRPPRG